MPSFDFFHTEAEAHQRVSSSKISSNKSTLTGVVSFTATPKLCKSTHTLWHLLGCESTRNPSFTTFENPSDFTSF